MISLIHKGSLTKKETIDSKASNESSNHIMYSFKGSSKDFTYRKFTQPEIVAQGPIQPVFFRQKCYCRFLWNTELHGVTQYLRAKTLLSKFFWACVIAAFLTAATMTTISVFSNYLENQTSTLITIKQNRSIYYPGIVLCPKNADSLNFTLIRNDLKKIFPTIENKTADNLVGFLIAGSGFDNMQPIVTNMSDAEMRQLNTMLKKWQGSQKLEDFYDSFYKRYGYNCHDFLRTCYYGSEVINCCDIFLDYYQMLRGRCMRLREFPQEDPDEVGKITVMMARMQSLLADPSGLQLQSVIYISDLLRDVATFPRFYLEYKTWNRIRFTARKIIMLPINNQCINDRPDYGKGTCFTETWLHDKIIKNFNCTVFYLKFKNPNLPICDPYVIVKNYAIVTSQNVNLSCKTACNRWENPMQVFTSLEEGEVSPDQSFWLEMSYQDLQYEVYEEIQVTTLPGFISQIGGQFSLYLGISSITLTQFISATIRFIYRKYHRFYAYHFGNYDLSKVDLEKK